MIFSNIKQFLEKNKKIFYYLGFFLVVFSLSSDVTFAVTPAEKSIIETTTDIVSAVLKGVSMFLGLMTYLATIFLSPEWINGSLFGMNEKFKEVWIMVSNIVYFIFAFILIWIAFMNIIGKGGDQYQLKQALPKFIVGVLIVPFSWFLVQFILSISAILTISALSLPFDTFPDYENKVKIVEIPKVCIINVGSYSLTTKDAEKKTNAKPFFKCEDETVKLGDVLLGGNSTNSIYGIISLYTYGIISLDTIAQLDQGDIANTIKVAGDVAVKLIFDALFIIVYSILIITLGLVLMIRGIYIWIYIMISPIFGLMYFFEKKDGGGDGFFAKFNIKEFIALAMVPVYTMLALSFGLLFMYVVGNGLTQESSGGIGGNNVTITDKGNEVNIGSGNNKFTLKITGAVSKADGDVTGFLKSIGNGVLGGVGALIMKLFGIVILWGTVMAAMRTSEITKAITEPIHAFGGKVGDIMSSAPGNIPVFGGISAKGMGQAASQVQTHFDNKSIKTGSEFVNKHMKFASNGNIDAKTLANEINSNGMSPSELTRARAMLSGKNVTDISTDSSLRSLVSALGKAAKIDDNLQKDSTLQNKDEVAKALHAINNTKESQFVSNGRLVADRELSSGDNNANKMNILLTGLSSSGNPDGGGSNDDGITTGNISDNRKFIDVNINGKGFSGDRDVSTGNITGFDQVGYKEIAKYVIQNKLNGDTFQKQILDELNVNKSDIPKIKKEIGKFIKEESGKYSFVGAGGNKDSNLDDLLKENNPK